MIFVLGIISIYLVFYDIRYKKVPNKIILLLFFIISFNILNNNGNLYYSLINGTLAFITFYLINAFSKGGLGIGDCKYAAIISMFFGYYFWLQSVMISSIIAIIISLILLKLKRINVKTKIPFIPFLVLGWVLNKIIFF